MSDSASPARYFDQTLGPAGRTVWRPVFVEEEFRGIARPVFDEVDRGGRLDFRVVVGYTGFPIFLRYGRND